jgi:hypothetical protein
MLVKLAISGVACNGNAIMSFLKQHDHLERLDIFWDVDDGVLDFRSLPATCLPVLREFTFRSIRSEHAVGVLAPGRPLRILRGFELRPGNDDELTPEALFHHIESSGVQLERLDFGDWDTNGWWTQEWVSSLARVTGATLVHLDLGFTYENPASTNLRYQLLVLMTLFCSR